MSTTESTINDALVEALASTRSLWRNGKVVTSENTQMLRDNSKRPDIIINEPDISPVIVEIEVSPALSVEEDALSRVGLALAINGRKVYSSIAVEVPESFRELHINELRQAIFESKDLKYVLYTVAAGLNIPDGLVLAG